MQIELIQRDDSFYLVCLDAFMGRGEPAVATNIINHTYRIQAWDFSRCNIPDLTDSK